LQCSGALPTVCRYELSSSFLASKGIDDPVNASPVHLFAGIVGAFRRLIQTFVVRIADGCCAGRGAGFLACNALVQAPSVLASLLTPFLSATFTRR
jgi:ammonia channel protein AmtB